MRPGSLTPSGLDGAALRLMLRAGTDGGDLMARSKRKNMQALSAFLTAVFAGLIAAAVVAIKNHTYVTGLQFALWAGLPLALLLVYAFPTRCRVKTSNNRLCRNNSYGFVFGCSTGGHWWLKAKARLGFHGEPVRYVQPRRVNYAVMYEPGLPGPEPVRVTVEDGGLGVCAFWVGVVGTVATVASFILTVAGR